MEILKELVAHLPKRCEGKAENPRTEKCISFGNLVIFPGFLRTNCAIGEPHKFARRTNFWATPMLDSACLLAVCGAPSTVSLYRPSRAARVDEERRRMEPGVPSAKKWSDACAGVRVVFPTARLTSVADNPIAVELHRMGKSPRSSCFTGVPRLPQ